MAMKILYGVQGTGNGHVSRANAMYEAFKAHPELEVTWLLSGRPRAQGCGEIPDFAWRRGLSFVTGNGGIRTFATLRQNNVMQFLRDVRELDLAPYDLVLSDYEPVVSHAAMRRGVPVIGIGHLYAFQYPVPLRGGNPFTTAILRKFAPASVSVGLHWHHFDAPLLPPILDLHMQDAAPAQARNKVLVYLPWENAQQVLAMLAPLKDYDFYVSEDSTQWGAPVASGTFEHGTLEQNRSPKRVEFTPQVARYIRFVAKSEIKDEIWSSVAELDVSGTPAP